MVDISLRGFDRIPIRVAPETSTGVRSEIPLEVPDAISPEVHRETLLGISSDILLTQYLPDIFSILLQKFVPEYFAEVYIGNIFRNSL